ncbi:lipopolysaccharide heptosyltransferase family protein [Stutzerimonas zhaodongensis]|uniref:Lipopolysaccharide heptosyltransferase family protein n=1 Tax=Stutzerimonas zhaodongensis TaxID=1176257 RepID=A0A3M2HUZ6_9GAMM|nr:glycosyltransferase family 9 protein [Stutzerimonas zhaodongensis]MCQ4315483.1 glycosyltransferase family 9 protein [Stutzerimonas zhaodongensis]RMH91643.1 lipopolysaccharide heptosyltransferase family protein [Stutzerimonas zhaodongensis]
MHTLEQPRASISRGDARVALISFDSLGDGLIYLMMADNLRANGYQIDCYGNIAYQLRDWLPQLNILPYPAPSAFEAAFEQYDFVIASPPSFLRRSFSETDLQRVRQKWALICQKTPQSWLHDHSAAASPELAHQFGGLLSCAGPIRFKTFDQESVVEITLQYMRERMCLERLTKQVSLTPPSGLKHRRHPRRIVISPDSAGPEKKNWSPAGFLKLCQTLRDKGYEPHIVVAPNNHARWERLADGRFPTPRFPEIGALAAFLYESGFLVANDSGNGHLASFLGIPTVTLYRKKNPLFHWRPDWAPGVVICPSFTLPKLEGSWRWFITPAMVLRAIENLSSH